jgi:hypothetical protein
MARRTLLIVALVLAASAVVTAAAVSQSQSNSRSRPTAAAPVSEEPLALTYDEAVAQGLDPQDLPAETGLPRCPTDSPPDPGFATAEAAEAAAEAASDKPSCAMAPEDTLFGFGFEAPHAGYHYTGHQSNGKFGDALRASLEIPNPNVSGGPSQEFLAGRILGKTDVGRWVEAGWVEHSLLTVDQGYTHPCVYGFANPQSQWHVYCSALPLTVGNIYVFKVEHVNNVGYVQGLILWNGSWYVIEQNSQQVCRTSGGDANCNWEAYLEEYTASGTHWNINGGGYDGAGTNFQAIQFHAISDGNWHLWDSSLHGAAWGEKTPYEYCGFSGMKWYQFTVKKDVNCSDP